MSFLVFSVTVQSGIYLLYSCPTSLCSVAICLSFNAKSYLLFTESTSLLSGTCCHLLYEWSLLIDMCLLCAGGEERPAASSKASGAVFKPHCSCSRWAAHLQFVFHLTGGFMVMHYFCISRLWGEVINEQNEFCVVLMGCDKNFLQGVKDKGLMSSYRLSVNLKSSFCWSYVPVLVGGRSQFLLISVTLVELCDTELRPGSGSLIGLVKVILIPSDTFLLTLGM